MTETLSRTYFGCEIASRPNPEPAEHSDGWSHRIGDTTFPTLADAVRFARSSVTPSGSGPAEVAADIAHETGCDAPGR